MPRDDSTGPLPTLASHLAAHCEFSGVCVPCWRKIIVSPAELIERYGAHAISREIMNRIVCKECGRPVEVSISKPGAREAYLPATRTSVWIEAARLPERCVSATVHSLPGTAGPVVRF